MNRAAVRTRGKRPADPHRRRRIRRIHRRPNVRRRRVSHLLGTRTRRPYLRRRRDPHLLTFERSDLHDFSGRRRYRSVAIDVPNLPGLLGRKYLHGIRGRARGFDTGSNSQRRQTVYPVVPIGDGLAPGPRERLHRAPAPADAAAALLALIRQPLQRALVPRALVMPLPHALGAVEVYPAQLTPRLRGVVLEESTRSRVRMGNVTGVVVPGFGEVRTLGP